MTATTTATKPPPLSPTTKYLKRITDRSMLDAAYQELLAMRAANGGKPCYKDIQTVINKFRSRGYESVSRHGLDYRIRLDKQEKKCHHKARTMYQSVVPSQY
jgi:hypothetical protein